MDQYSRSGGFESITGMRSGASEFGLEHTVLTLTADRSLAEKVPVGLTVNSVIGDRV